MNITYYGAKLFYSAVLIAAVLFTVAAEAFRWYFKVMVRIVKRFLKGRA